MNEYKNLHSEKMKEKINDPWSCGQRPNVAVCVVSWTLALVIVGLGVWLGIHLCNLRP